MDPLGSHLRPEGRTIVVQRPTGHAMLTSSSVLAFRGSDIGVWLFQRQLDLADTFSKFNNRYKPATRDLYIGSLEGQCRC